MRTRAGALLGSFAFFWVAPGTVAGLVPYLLTGWSVQRPLLGGRPVQIAGGILVGLGAATIVECFARFAIQGRGTPAPIAPPERLVVSGPYRRVRNPMYVAVLLMVVGQALLFGRGVLLVYGASLWVVFHVFVLAYEEPTLRRQFGASYDTYRANVPRWWPRPRPWPGAGVE